MAFFNRSISITIFVVFANVFLALNEPAHAEVVGVVQQRDHYMELSVYAI